MVLPSSRRRAAWMTMRPKPGPKRRESTQWIFASGYFCCTCLAAVTANWKAPLMPLEIVITRSSVPSETMASMAAANSLVLAGAVE